MHDFIKDDNFADKNWKGVISEKIKAKHVLLTRTCPPGLVWEVRTCPKSEFWFNFARFNSKTEFLR